MDLVTLAMLVAASAGPPAVQHPASIPTTVATSSVAQEPSAAIDRWQPFIAEASLRFGIPEPWIRNVMRTESAGLAMLDGAPITSSAGAMGLMQVMPETYEAMRKRYGLGADPYDPHDNILAGAAFLRELSGRYGYPGCLAAYHAGPRRFEQYLRQGRSLPPETWRYLAEIAPGVAESVLAEASASALLPPNAPSSGTVARGRGPSAAALFFILRTGSTDPLQAGDPVQSDARASALFVPLHSGSTAAPDRAVRP